MNTKRAIIGVLAAAVLVVAMPWQAQAQEPGAQSDDRFHFTIAPYFLAPSMNGDLTIRGRDIEVGVGPTEIFDNLKFGFMGYFQVRKNRWGFAFDTLYMDLERGAQVDTILGPVGASVGVRQGMYEFAGSYRAAPWIDAVGGLRINHISARFETSPFGLSGDASKTWVDPFVGVHLRVPDTGRWLLAVRSDIGGFGVGSNVAWQVYPTVGYAFSDLFMLAGGYRYLDMKYETGEGNELFVYDVATSGPYVGFAFRF